MEGLFTSSSEISAFFSSRLKCESQASKRSMGPAGGGKPDRHARGDCARGGAAYSVPLRAASLLPLPPGFKQEEGTGTPLHPVSSGPGRPGRACHPQPSMLLLLQHPGNSPPNGSASLGRAFWGLSNASGQTAMTPSLLDFRNTKVCGAQLQTTQSCAAARLKGPALPGLKGREGDSAEPRTTGMGQMGSRDAPAHHAPPLLCSLPSFPNPEEG